MTVQTGEYLTQSEGIYINLPLPTHRTQNQQTRHKIVRVRQLAVPSAVTPVLRGYIRQDERAQLMLRSRFNSPPEGRIPARRHGQYPKHSSQLIKITHIFTLSIATSGPCLTPRGVTRSPCRWNLVSAASTTTTQGFDSNERRTHTLTYQGRLPADLHSRIPPGASTLSSSAISSSTSFESSLNQSRWSIITARVRDHVFRPRRTL